MFGFGDSESKSKEKKPAAGGGGGDGGNEGGGADPAAAGGGGDGEEKKIGTMPSGDYVIHIHLQNGKNFFLPDEDTCDPYVQIEVLGQSKKSSFKNDITPDSSVNFNEHIFIELKKIEDEEASEAKLKFTVLNKGFFKGDVIGEIELSLSKIYDHKNHVMMHQRLGLTNPNGDDFSKMTGSLVISVNVQGPGDEATELKMGSTKEWDANQIIMPSSVKKEYKQLYLNVYQATNLPKMDYQLIGTGSIDAYLKIMYHGKKLKTKVIKQKDNLVPWMEQFLIPVEVPVIYNKLILQVYDKDNLYDELAATTELSIKNMIKYDRDNQNLKQNTQCKWINLYGAPVGRSGSNTNKMNENPENASTWKGRILVEYWCEDYKYPTFEKKPIPADFDRYMFNIQTQPAQYLIIGEFGTGMCLPAEETYRMQLCIGETMFDSGKPKNHASDWCRWDNRFGGEVIALPYKSGKQMPTFFIYLVDSDDVPVCYYRDSLINYKDQNGPVQWRNFEPDLSHGVVTKEQKAGYFSFRLYFHEIEKQGPFDPMMIPTWKRPPEKRLTPFKARVAIYQCENLPPADKTGNSDPYIQVYDPQDPDIKTEVCHDTNNPIFYEVKEFKFQCASRSGKLDLASAPPIILNVWDRDEDVLDSTDDLIGRAVINLQEAAHSDDDSGLQHISFNDDIPYPAWYPVKKNYDDQYDLETGASILVSIQIIELDDQFSLPAEQIKLNQSPPPMISGNRRLNMPDLQMSEFKCEVIVLALRDLVSTGLLPVNKSYIKFGLKSLLPVSQANAVDNIFTQPNAKGSNPIIRTTIQFEVQMPNDPTFLPRMTCEVFDQLFIGGVGQPQIGTFTLKLGEIVQDMREKIENDIKMANKLAKTVEKVAAKIRGQSGENRQRAAEICASVTTSNIDQVSQMTQQERIGKALLKKLESEGMQIPPSASIKNKKKKSKADRVAKDKDVHASTANDLSKKKLDAQALQKQGTELPMEAKSNSQQASDVTRAVGTNLRKKVQLAFEADLAEKKRELQIARKEDQAALAGREGAYGNRVEPLYKYDERLCIDREVDPPATSLFKAVGHNKTKNDGIKHYRRYYADELENVTDKNGMPIISSPFIHENIFRAKPVKQGGLLGNLFGGDDNADFVSLNVGYFKGTVRCYIPEIRQKAQQDHKDQLKVLMEQIINVYKIENRGQDPMIKPNIINTIDEMDDNDRKEALKQIRQVIEDAGLEKLNIFPMIDDLSFQSSLVRRLNEVQQCKIFVYMIEGFNFAQRDLFSASDPYLKMRCGKTSFDERDNYQLDTAEPKFYKCYQFKSDFPGSPRVWIYAYDYDDLFGDDLIGYTTIDLDDRYFSQTWLAIEDKPIEYRDLFDDSSTITQGVVKLWVEIHDIDSPEANKPPIDINPEPVLDFECRVVIWKTKDIEMMDVEGTSDVFVRCFFDDKDDKTTDTHWRCQNGEASFNYRLLFPLKSQNAAGYNLTIQAWDKDIIASNDIIGSCNLPIDALVEDAVLTHKPQYINVKYFDEYMREQMRIAGSPVSDDIYFDSVEKDRFWVPVHRQVQEQNKTVKAGEIMISLCLIPKKLAEKNPQGSARQEPNSDPFCPPPEGRISLTLNPFKMFTQLVGPAMRRKIICFLLLLACAFLCAMCAPMIFSNIVTRLIVG